MKRGAALKFFNLRLLGDIPRQQRTRIVKCYIYSVLKFVNCELSIAVKMGIIVVSEKMEAHPASRDD